MSTLGGAEKSSTPCHARISNQSRVAKRGIQWDA
jgi:hypothetical protein